MGFRFNIILPIIIFYSAILALLNGCISYQIIKGVDGREVKPPDTVLVEEKTTINEALTLLGAPDKLTELNGMDLLLNQRSVFQRNRLSLVVVSTSFWMNAARAGWAISCLPSFPGLK